MGCFVIGGLRLCLKVMLFSLFFLKLFLLSELFPTFGLVSMRVAGGAHLPNLFHFNNDLVFIRE